MKNLFPAFLLIFALSALPCFNAKGDTHELDYDIENAYRYFEEGAGTGESSPHSFYLYRFVLGAREGEIETQLDLARKKYPKEFVAEIEKARGWLNSLIQDDGEKAFREYERLGEYRKATELKGLRGRLLLLSYEKGYLPAIYLYGLERLKSDKDHLRSRGCENLRSLALYGHEKAAWVLVKNYQDGIHQQKSILRAFKWLEVLLVHRKIRERDGIDETDVNWDDAFILDIPTSELQKVREELLVRISNEERETALKALSMLQFPSCYNPD